MSLYAQVLPDPGRALSQLFTYRVPEHLLEEVRLGAQVLVPFGPRTVVGVVAGLAEHTDRENLKDIEAVLEDVPALSEDALPLARWMADHYLCELGEAIRPFLAEGMNYRIGRRFRLSSEAIPPSIVAHADAGPLIRHLQAQGRDVGLGALRRLLPPARLQRALRLLKSRQVIEEKASVVAPRARQRQVRLVEVAVAADEVERYCQERGARAPARVSALRAAAEAGPLQAGELAERAGVSVSAVQGLLQDGLLRARWIPVRRKPWRDADRGAAAPPTLMPEQQEAVAAIEASLHTGATTSFLLYGVTASGKTEVFLRVIEGVLAAGKQAIVLMPEISLTAQAVGIYRARFGERVAMLHSALSLGERWDEWQRIRTGEAGVIVGARSAVFAPIRSLGLIVVDEEHETSYKQEQAPRYHAREVALTRGELNRCPVVLASATPSLESFYDAERGRHRLLRLPVRVDDRPLPKTRIVDMRGGAAQPAILSTVLRQAVAARLREGEQVILFLNRRGFATFMLCPVCGEALRCPDCGVALKYHRGIRQVRCHHCGLARAAPDACAKCGGPHIRFSGFGTERVEGELRGIFPAARPGRMDRDTTSRRGAHVEIVGQFATAETNVLIGTQMVAKGFDFPGVTLVGVISADTSLNLPDFRAAERTFQLLTQVSGRAGRGEKEGEVIVQTYRPDDSSIQAAARHDYESFYRTEIANRRELNYPPIRQLINLIVSAEDEHDAAERAEAMAEALRRVAEGREVDVLGPAPAPLAKLRRRHRWHVMVKGRQGEAQEVVRRALAGLGEQGRGTISVDVDPVSLM
ncbi:MAG TPA: primosomal protein N' [Armatimonadota bacterium]|nr:primosomal protein N' [Armatimonadota bacterium]